MGIIEAYFSGLIAIGLLQIVALASPGPDFALILRNSLVYSRRVALYSALGIALGVCIHLTYVLLGLGAVLAESEWAFSAIKVLGSSYLIYLGVMAIMTRKPVALQECGGEDHESGVSPFQALSMGFFTNALNPKAILFILSLFTVIIDPEMPLTVQLLFALEIVLLSFLWFVILALSLSHPRVRAFFAKGTHWIERVTGVFLIVVGCKIILFH